MGKAERLSRLWESAVRDHEFNVSQIEGHFGGADSEMHLIVIRHDMSRVLTKEVI